MCKLQIIEKILKRRRLYTLRVIEKEYLRRKAKERLNKTKLKIDTKGKKEIRGGN